MVWLRGPENKASAHVRALVTERVGAGCGVHALPLRRHLAGAGHALEVPAGMDPLVLGESVNGITTYGYDPVTAIAGDEGDAVQRRTGVRPGQTHREAPRWPA